MKSNKNGVTGYCNWYQTGVRLRHQLTSFPINSKNLNYDSNVGFMGSNVCRIWHPKGNNRRTLKGWQKPQFVTRALRLTLDSFQEDWKDFIIIVINCIYCIYIIYICACCFIYCYYFSSYYYFYFIFTYTHMTWVLALLMTQHFSSVYSIVARYCRQADFLTAVLLELNLNRT